MTEKRFTMCHRQNDANGWTMSIVDWETKEPFDYTTYEVHSVSITDTKEEMEDLCDLLNELNDENEQLKQQIKRLEAQLHCPFDSICINCINEYLVQKDKYYVSKCRKGHEQCSKSDVKYCDDFELKGDVE